MAGITIVTDLEPDEAVKSVKKVAKDLSFSVDKVDEWEIRAQKGNLALSILFGAFIAYCDFRILFEESKKGINIVIERNTPWWTGLIGVSRVKTAVKKLADEIEHEIEDRGGQVIDRKDH